MHSTYKRYWSEIDLDAAEYNFSLIKRGLSENTKLCCVVKADAYGHGAVKLAKLYESLGADYFAVSNISEALQLRENDIKKPILILGYTNPDCAELIAKYDIEQCVFSKEYGILLAECAKKSGVKIKIHIKLDSGMGRIGFSCKHMEEDACHLSDALEICKMNCFIPYGIFTHFAVADEGEEGKNYTLNQYKAFCFGCEFLEKNGIKFKVKHCGNSAAILNYPELNLDMVRAGLILYGLSPSEKCSDFRLKPVMSLKTVISQTKELAEGDMVSYGCTYKADKNITLATVPVGYADGLWRCNAKCGEMLVSGKRVSVKGRICMDQTMLDVSGVGDAKIGDTVVILGKSGDEYISADEIAKRCGTINYEIICSVGKRVARLYTKNNEIVDIIDNLHREN